jgi:thioredoxin 1
MSNAASITAQDFEREVLQSSEPVVVDFTAAWCPPCRALAPVLDRAAQSYEGRVKILKCDVDENQDLAARYGVMTIPNLTFFKGGQVVDQAVGFMSDAQLATKIDGVLSK